MKQSEVAKNTAKVVPYFCCGVAVFATLLSPVCSSSDEANPELRFAVENALPYLEEEGTWWIEKKKCASCHHTSFLVWAKELALASGFPVDKKNLAGQRDWMWASFLEEVESKEGAEPPKEKELEGERNIEGVSQFLISPAVAGIPEEDRKRLLEIIRKKQTKEGDWKPGGQLPRQERPAKETQWVSNQWALLALESSGEKPAKPAATWEDGVPAVTSEWQMLNLLRRPENRITQKNFLQLQNEDGSWSWKKGESGSPSATGQALIALGRSGLGKSHPQVVRKAQQYLIASQEESGHWETMSTKDRSESTRVSDFWGTAWAVIGLLESEK